MSRFLICSFALVLLYPQGLICTSLVYRASPPISMPGSAVAYCVLRLSGGDGGCDVFAGKVADRSGRKPVAIPGAAYLLSPRCSVHWLKPARYFLRAISTGTGRGLLLRSGVRHFRDTLDDRRRAKVLSLLNGITASFRC